jgi:hypothetical protein
MDLAFPATELPGVGVAATCAILAPASHRPVPLRFVWHHVQPHEAGGQTIPANLIQLCDSCHYSIHRLMWNLARSLPQPAAPNRKQLALATLGYVACVAAGTVAQIPNEG